MNSDKKYNSVLDETFGLLDAFFVRFYNDSIETWDKETIDIVIKRGSNGKFSTDDPEIKNGLMLLEKQGKITVNYNHPDFIIMDRKYWDERLGIER